ncbi:TVP38/TMEM64 family protein [Desulfurispira natronophila]|uniref:TVP38/TMEM64 family membrane protein n=1 Tax=Desulfurispira natronophila TaxID=682562 RepID=A0A7W7Y5P2_9BACT|nr:VTT domain-containing protein [Desulfurispira natronophila]MBB5022556.1 putative membrane protein YdjX (TVP38/TMEM64 family) [Desulfurispira natronophila]
MVDLIADFLRQYGIYAAIISILINILATIVGVFPTFLITAANIVVFGLWAGTLISFLGESLGAIAAFVLYRKGFRRRAQRILDYYPRAQRLVNLRGREAFDLIFLLRLLPFAPAWVSTFGAAIGKVPLLLFIAASTLGKIPALLMEAYAVYEVTRFQWQGKTVLLILASLLAWDIWKRLRRQEKN